MDMNDEKIGKLLAELHAKLRHGEEYDAKFAIENSNTINWIITLTTFYFLLLLNNYNKLAGINFMPCIIKGFQILFTLIILLFFVFRLVLYRYELKKKQYLSLLELHFIELDFDKSKIKMPEVSSEKFVIDFNNAFVAGDFDIRRKIDFKRFAKSIKLWGKIFKYLYWLLLGLFFILSLLSIYIIFSIKF